MDTLTHSFTAEHRYTARFTHTQEIDGAQVRIGTLDWTTGTDGEPVPIAWRGALTQGEWEAEYWVIKWKDSRLFPDRTPSGWKRGMLYIHSRDIDSTREDAAAVANALYPEDAADLDSIQCAGPGPAGSYPEYWKADWKEATTHHALTRAWKRREDMIERYAAKNATGAKKVASFKRRIADLASSIFTNNREAIESEIVRFALECARKA